MINLCKKLKSKGFKLGILANESHQWMNIKRKKGKLNDIFDVVSSSADMKLAKPQKEAFEIILHSLKSKSEETLFIDDRKINTIAAKEVGMKSILFTNINQLKKELLSFKISID